MNLITMHIESTPHSHTAVYFYRYLQGDKEEAEALRLAKLLEEEKAQFSVSCLENKQLH